MPYRNWGAVSGKSAAAVPIGDGVGRLTDNATAPHILIEGRPDLTKRLWDQCEVKPLVLSARVASSPIYFATREAAAASPDAEPAIYSFSGTALLPGMERHYPEIVRETKRALADIVALARERFDLRPTEKVRIAVAGSQGSLWLREHANVAMVGWLFPEAQDETDGAWALGRLGRAAQNRGFVKDLQAALQGLEGVKVDWLTHAFPGLGGEPDAPRRFHEVAARARKTLATDLNFRDMQGTAPLLYTRRDSGDWARFTGIWLQGEKETDRGRNPFLTTSQLIQQYRDYHSRDGLECVLVKVIANPQAANPCDNPIITVAHLQQARDAGISAILLDAGHGVADLVTEGPDYLDDVIEWQREAMLKSLRETEPLRRQLTKSRWRSYRSLNAGAAYFLAKIQDMYELRAELKNAAAADGPFAKVDLSASNPFRRLQKDFRAFHTSEEPIPPKPDPAGDDLPPAPRPDDLDRVSNDMLVREIINALGHVASEIERDVLKGPVNAQAALKVVDSVDRDLILAVSYCNTLMERLQAKRHSRALLGGVRTLWSRLTGRAAAGDAPPDAGILAGAGAFLRAMQMVAGLHRSLDAAGEDLHARLATYPDRPGYPPIYRV
ncbi:MAG TPA: hypothetical protein VMS43_05615 [Allosphingosinicella sp.]|nr:hypothetical protein [Allosphingosinicella sp.]